MLVTREHVALLRLETGCGIHCVRKALEQVNTLEEARAFLKWNSLAIAMKGSDGKPLTPIERMARGMEIDAIGQSRGYVKRAKEMLGGV